MKWTSSNKKIAYIGQHSKKGAWIKSRKKGGCTITAQIGRLRLKCKVTVKKYGKKISADTKEPAPALTSTPTPAPIPTPISTGTKFRELVSHIKKNGEINNSTGNPYIWFSETVDGTYYFSELEYDENEDELIYSSLYEYENEEDFSTSTAYSSVKIKERQDNTCDVTFMYEYDTTSTIVAGTINAATYTSTSNIEISRYIGDGYLQEVTIKMADSHLHLAFWYLEYTILPQARCTLADIGFVAYK